MGILVAMYTSLAVTYPTGNLSLISGILLSPSGVNFGVLLIFNVLIKDVSDDVTTIDIYILLLISESTSNQIS
jgi:hypothetical protein